MRIAHLDGMIRAAAGALLLATVLAGCDRPAPQATPSEAPSPAPAPPAETLPGPDATPAEPAQPAPDPPPPSEPSAVPKPAATEPELDSMLVAKASSKLSWDKAKHATRDAWDRVVDPLSGNQNQGR